MNENFAIQLFEGNKVRIVWDAEQEKYYFAVADIVQVLTDTVNPRDYIKKMLRRDPELKSKWGTICPPVEMLAPDGKRRKTQAADLTGIFHIIESIPSKKAEPVRQSPITNVLTKAWSGLTTGEYKRYKGLKKENLRDNMTNIELALNTLAEVATTEYSKQSNPQTMAESQRIAQEGGNVARDARQTMERRLGRSVVSPERASDYIKPVDSKAHDALPLENDDE